MSGIEIFAIVATVFGAVVTLAAGISKFTDRKQDADFQQYHRLQSVLGHIRQLRAYNLRDNRFMDPRLLMMRDVEVILLKNQLIQTQDTLIALMGAMLASSGYQFATNTMSSGWIEDPYHSAPPGWIEDLYHSAPPAYQRQPMFPIPTLGDQLQMMSAAAPIPQLPYERENVSRWRRFRRRLIGKQH